MAALEGGGRISVRAALGEDEEPVVRPYVLVDAIEAASPRFTACGWPSLTAAPRRAILVCFCFTARGP
jgi:hypothetical protein